MRRPLIPLLSITTLLAVPLLAQAQAFPTRPITLIVPFAVGGAADTLARTLGERLGTHLGQSVVVENMAGAGGTIGLNRAARAEPDGYTILMGNIGTHASSYALNPSSIRYQPSDFKVLGLVAKSDSVIALRQGFPAANLDEFLAYAKQHPDTVTLGHAGIGSSNYLICRTFAHAAGVKLSLVPYRGAGPALNDLLGEQIDGVCDSSTSVSGHVRSGRVRGLVVSGSQRAASLPDVPSATEAGLPGFDFSSWNALFVPAAVPADRYEVLLDALTKTLADPEIAQRYASAGTTLPTPEESAPAYLEQALPKEIEQFKRILVD